MDPTFSQDVFPLDGKTRFFYLKKKMIFRKYLESPLIFVLFLKENKIRKKTLSVTPYLEKIVCGRPKSDSRVRLLIGKVR